MSHAAALQDAPASQDAPVSSSIAGARTMRRALAALSLAILMPSLDTSIANVALPAMASGFGAPFREVQWIVLAYLLAVTALIVSAGALGDRLGRRRLFLTGIGVFTVASLLCGVAPSLALLVAARALQGVGAALMLALAVAFVGDIVPESRRGSTMGWLGTMSAVGTTLGPSLGGILLARSGWPMIFLVNIPIGIVTFALAATALPPDEARARDARRFDVAGTALLAATLAAYALAMTLAEHRGGATVTMLLLLTAVGAWQFARRMARAHAPLLPLDLLRTPTVRSGLATIALVSTVMMATLVVGPFYLARTLALPPAQLGLALSAGPLVAAIAGIPAGRLVDRLGTARMTTRALVSLLGGLLLLAIVPSSMGVAGYVGPMCVVTASYALFQAATITAVTREAGAQQRGVIAGLLGVARNLGLITGASAMGAVFATATLSADVASASPSAVSIGMRVSYGVAALLAAAALALVTVVRSRPSDVLPATAAEGGRDAAAGYPAASRSRTAAR